MLSFMLPNYQARSPFVLKHTTSWRASGASETVLGVNNAKSGICYGRARVASETVLGVDNAKSGICYIYVCMYVWMVRMLFKRARGKRFSPKNTAI